MSEIVTWTPERKELIKKTYCKGGSDLDLELFIATCERLKLSPEARQIYAVIRSGKNGPQMTIQVSIDGFRLVAERSGHYEGQTPVQWCGMDGVWQEIWTKSTNPIAARVGVLKRGFRLPLYAVAHWNEYCQTNYNGKPSQFWERMPRLMLGKVAEALALRKAFPNELSGVYSEDEMSNVIDTTPSQPPQSHLGSETAQPPNQIIPPVYPPTDKPCAAKPTAGERLPKMVAAFKEHFEIDALEIEAIIHKPIAEFTDVDLETMEQIFKDLKNNRLTKEDLESIKEVLSENEVIKTDRGGMGKDMQDTIESEDANS